MGKGYLDLTPELPPLDDEAHWLPLDAARNRRIEQTGDPRLALIDLTNALTQGHLRCMIRTAGQRRRVATTAWRYQFILSAKEGLRILQRYPDFTGELHGWTFLIWQPDLDAIWPPGDARGL